MNTQRANYSSTQGSSIWDIITEISNSDIGILSLLDADGNVTNPFLAEQLAELITKSNRNAGINNEIPFIAADIVLKEFIYHPQIKVLTSRDPHELALSELLRHKGAGTKVTPQHGYHLFIKGKHITYSIEKSMMESEAGESFKYLLGKLTGKNKDKREITVKPLAAHLFNYILDYYVKEKDDTVERIRMDIASRDKIALGTALAFFGLPSTASEEDLTLARKKLLAKSHPDLVANDSRLQKQNEALSMKINETYEFIKTRMG